MELGLAQTRGPEPLHGTRPSSLTSRNHHDTLSIANWTNKQRQQSGHRSAHPMDRHRKPRPGRASQQTSLSHRHTEVNMLNRKRLARTDTSPESGVRTRRRFYPAVMASAAKPTPGLDPLVSTRCGHARRAMSLAPTRPPEVLSPSGGISDARQN